MYSKFKYERIPLSLIHLDERNPRIVTAEKPKSDKEIIKYFFDYEDLVGFIKKIASEGRNQGAERPYIIKSGKEYTVIEGNTRIAAYKLLTGQLSPPEGFDDKIPHIPNSVKEDLLSVDCTIAPSRDALLPIMASAHFGLGDKSKWGYLGSRKAVYDEWKAGKSIAQLASAFDRKPGQIRDLLLEYELYLEALKLDWTDAENTELRHPAVEFNPPVRFLQTTGHRSSVGLEMDRVNISVSFQGEEAKRKFRHLVKKLVINPEKGLGATATYQDVFSDFAPKPNQESSKGPESGHGGPNSDDTQTGKEGESDKNGTQSPQPKQSPGGPKLAKGALFSYQVTGNNALLIQLMKEASKINASNFPASATALLRSVVEAILKTIILDQGANSQNKLLSLETSLDICLSNLVQLSQDDKKILKEFKKSHLDYVNLGAHSTIIPNALRLMAARDCIDQFVMRNI